MAAGGQGRLREPEIGLSTTSNLKQAYIAARTLFTSTPRDGIASLGKRVLLLAASSPSDSDGAVDVKKDLVDDGTSIFTIYFEDLPPAPVPTGGQRCYSIADNLAQALVVRRRA